MALVIQNRLLEALPREYRQNLQPYLEPVAMPLRTPLYNPEMTPKWAHFLTSGIGSVITSMADGTGSEVTIVGCEGLVEAVHLLGPASVQMSAFTQIAGTALRMPYAVLQREFQNNEEMHRLVLEYVQYQTLVLSQMTACNRLHAVDTRLARWLLMVEDKIGDSTFDLTQEFLAEMLGARRTSVSLAAGSLQRAGHIAYRRGRVTIQNRKGRMSMACECYAVVKSLDEKLFSASEK